MTSHCYVAHASITIQMIPHPAAKGTVAVETQQMLKPLVCQPEALFGTAVSHCLGGDRQQELLLDSAHFRWDWSPDGPGTPEGTARLGSLAHKRLTSPSFWAAVYLKHTVCRFGISWWLKWMFVRAFCDSDTFSGLEKRLSRFCVAFLVYSYKRFRFCDTLSRRNLCWLFSDYLVSLLV